MRLPDEVLKQKAELRSDQAVHTRCKRCGAPVLAALVGRVAALKVYADSASLDQESEAQAHCQSLMTWCLRTGHAVLPDRLIWRGRMHREAGTCTHTVVADHVCEDRKKGREVSKDNPFGIKQPGEKKTNEVKRDRYGRYLLPHPETGKEQSWQRVTTFCKITTDQFNLTAWQLRNVAIGIAQRPDLSALASTMDVTKDRSALNDICEKAKEAAGSTSAANRGTALHAMTEAYDETGSLDNVNPVYWPRMVEYGQALKDAGIFILPHLIERIIVHTGFGVAGTFDRIVQLSDGSLCVLDLKTGRDLSYGWQEIAVQLALYASGYNDHGVFDAGSGTWDAPDSPVREDFALVVHMPATGEGVTVHRLDLASGRKGADLCASVRSYRKTKAGVKEYEPAAPPGIKAVKDLIDQVAASRCLEEIIQVRNIAKSAGRWNLELAAVCKLRAAALKGR